MNPGVVVDHQGVLWEGGVSFGLIQPQESIEKENHDAEVDEVADLVVSLGQQYIVHKSVTSV